jgi:hypothetical protein
VDSLCIEQDNLVDCKRQIGLMDQIYSNAVITIVAASGNDAEAGLAGLCTAPRKMVQIKEEINGRTLLITQRLLKGQLLESKWFSRGWTYQEASYLQGALSSPTKIAALSAGRVNFVNLLRI